MAAARSLFVFLLLGQNGFHHVAGLVYVRQIDLGLKSLRRPERRTGLTRARTAPSIVRTHLVRLVILNGARVRELAVAQAELCQCVKNLPALDFHLAREIVDSNLAHPPLFRICYPKP
jgi:hypothetical protein